MSETKLLITASTSMVFLAFLSAGLLHWMNAGHGWVLIGSTLIGIAAYVAIFLVAGRHVKKADLIEEQQTEFSERI